MVQIEERDINSMKLFEELKNIFENKREFEDIKVEKTLKILDDKGVIVTQWYPTKWYRHKKTGVIWAFGFPDFPEEGYLYKLDENGEPVKESIFYIENRRRR